MGLLSRTDKTNKEYIAYILGIILSLFHLYTGYFGLLIGMYQRAIHFSFILSICFLIFPAVKNEKFRKYTNIVDLFFVILSIIPGIYVLLTYYDIVNRIGNPNKIDVYLGIILILLTLEAIRRTCGMPLCLVATVFILFALLGPYLPVLLRHRGYNLFRIAPYLYLTTEGIYGIPLGVAASYIILFVIFSELLKVCGAGDFFMNIAYSITAWSRGGPAKSAVISSAFFGTISGSAMANVATTGTFTIPLMIKTGYNPVFAAAVESVASTGGLIMPPVMGSAAFIMAEVLNIPYISICYYAILPAFLYYISLFFTIDLEAQKLNLKGISRKDIGNIKDILLSGYEYIVPIIALVFFLVKQWSPSTAVTISISMLLVVSILRKKENFTLKNLLKALSNGAQMSVSISCACAAAGIIMGIVSMTGVGLKITSIIIHLSHNSLFLALLLTMVASLILGMGMPSSACYIILAVLAAPVLITLGIEKIAAHLFIFYFGILSNITPPVALAAYTAAGISNTNNLKVGLKSVQIGMIAFFVPFMFVYEPSLLLIGNKLIILRTLTTSLIGCYVISIAIVGWFYGKNSYIQRLFWFIAGLLLIYPGFISDIIGLIICAIIGVTKYVQYKK